MLQLGKRFGRPRDLSKNALAPAPARAPADDVDQGARQLSAEQEAAVSAWCAAQMRPWQDARLMRDEVEAVCLDAFNRSNRFWLFRFEGSHVERLEKQCLDNGRDASFNMLRSRSLAYHRFFADVAARYPFDTSVTLVLDLHDVPEDRLGIPLFSFQKPAGTDYLLFPDIDAVAYDFYSEDKFVDRLGYDDKHPAAGFVGSTSGSLHDVESVRRLTDARLRAGVYFADKPEVSFKLPNLVQWHDQETRAALRALGFGRGQAPWSEQFRSRFLISMDGNGATCSRMAIALASNSVLLKYDSCHTLYYFSTLLPFLHYVPVARDAEVVAIVRSEVRHPGTHRFVADSGRDFARRFLTRDVALRYTARLIASYADLWRQADEEPAARTARSGTIHVSGMAHVACVGDVFANGAAPWIGIVGSGQPLEAFNVSAEVGGGYCDLKYRVLREDGDGDWCGDGDLAGTCGIGRAITGLEIGFDGQAMSRFAGRLDVRLIDGTGTTEAFTDGATAKVAGTMPIEAFRLTVEARSGTSSASPAVADGRPQGT